MTGLATRKQISTIGPAQGFLAVLAAWWLGRAGPDPLAVADGVFLMPTRRAARGLQEAFLRQADGQPLLLPRIVALGGLDEAPLMLAGALDLKAPVPAAERLAILSRFILALNGQHGAPTGADRAWTLAGELAALLDEAARAEIDLAAVLPHAAGGDFAEHWNVTLDFLTIVTRAWPAWLAVAGYTDVAAHQIALLDAQCAAWEAAPPATPIIAAGTTGAIPAVARLLAVVSRLPQGMVVLPGLDLELDEASWAALDSTHPQASLRALLDALSATRGDVVEMVTPAAAAPVDAARVAAWRLALLPAASLHRWQGAPSPATSGMTLLESADQQEEATAIALILRGALAQPAARAALVTPDRALAQRVAAALLRYGIVADDSAGEKLSDTPPAVLVRLLAHAVAQNLAPVALLSLLKHPLCALGLSPAICRTRARDLEKSLRGPRPAPGLQGLHDRCGADDFLNRIARCLRPVLALTGLARAAPQEALHHLIAAAEAVAATDDMPGATRLWAGEDGAALSAHMIGLLEAFAQLPPQPPHLLPALLDAALAGIAVRSRRALRGRDGAEHPRVFIWGLLEARLQAADVIVLGGLLESVWPPVADPGPWMNRAMRATIGLPSPEESVGLAAHDFVSVTCAAPSVVLSVPRRRDGAPAVPSRWVVRLQALLQGSFAHLARSPAVGWARALDLPAGAPHPVQPPAPAPPVAWRPRRLRVTEVETWLRDPYAIYARHVLDLKRLDPLEQSAGAADYGNIVHAGMQLFYERFPTGWPADAEAQFVAAMDQALAEARVRPALAAWWQPRLRRIAAWVADAEADRRRDGRPHLIRAEVTGDWQLEAPAGPFTLSGRADRIERRYDGGLAILDYKTGTAPSLAAVEEGRAPQLPLEAAMLRAGAFGDDIADHAAELTYWCISGGYTPGEIRQPFKDNPAGVRQAGELADARLRARLAAFDDGSQAYLSQPYPGAAPRFSDYAKLARVAEWAAIEDAPS